LFFIGFGTVWNSGFVFFKGFGTVGTSLKNGCDYLTELSLFKYNWLFKTITIYLGNLCPAQPSR
jgi:hypothetical protein